MFSPFTPDRLIKSVCTLLVFLLSLGELTAQTPVISYFDTWEESPAAELKGPHRVIELNDRKGLNVQSIHSRIILPEHTLNSEKGAVSMWVASLEDLSPVPKFGGVDKHNPDHRVLPLLSLNPDPQKLDSTAFKWIWKPYWHASFRVMWVTGHYYWGIFEPHPIGASLIGNEFHFNRHQWYHLVLTWDHSTNVYRLYANGVMIGTEPYHLEKPFRYEKVPGDQPLYTGSPQLCYGEINFYDEVLSAETVKQQYQTEATDYNAEIQEELLSLHTGVGKKAFDFALDHQWEEKLSLSLQEPQHLDSFYVQGYTKAPEVTAEGLRLRTPFELMDRSRTVDQVYLWTWKTFEGDIYIEYDFKINRRGGLSLLMFNASGMNREDFMKDYPLRTTGTMRMVAWEDVRNYHWEYYRDQIDARNDVASSAMLKNPYQAPMYYTTSHELQASDVWHKLQLVQRGNHIVGAIDGVILIDAIDNGFANDGAVFDYGHVAIRCMLNSDVTFRNLKIYNRNQGFKVLKAYQGDK